MSEFSRGFGKEAALTALLDAARGEAVVPMVADLQDPPALLGLILSTWFDGPEMGLARRRDQLWDGVFTRTAGP